MAWVAAHVQVGSHGGVLQSVFRALVYVLWHFPEDWVENRIDLCTLRAQSELFVSAHDLPLLREVHKTGQLHSARTAALCTGQGRLNDGGCSI